MLSASIMRAIPSSCLLLALILHSAPAQAGEASAAKLGRQCDKGQARACAALADHWELAAQQACEQGAVQACTGLAQASLQGFGLEDPDQASWAYDRACIMGISEACSRLELVRRMAEHPERAFSPLTVVLSPAGLRIQGPKAALFSSFPHDGDELFFRCQRDQGCDDVDHFDWDGLSAALEQIEARDPSRQQALLRYQEVRTEVVFEAVECLAGRHD